MCTPKSGLSAAPGMTSAEFAAMEKAHGFGSVVPRITEAFSSMGSDGESGGGYKWDKDSATAGLQSDLGQWIKDNPQRYAIGMESNRLDALQQAGKSRYQAARSPKGSPNPAAGQATGGDGGGSAGSGMGEISGDGATQSFQLGAGGLLSRRGKSLLGA